MSIKLLYIVLLCAFFAPVFAQNSHWVSTTGDDVSGNGSKGLPYRTINFAISKVVKHDTVIVNNGVYNEAVQILNKPDFVLKGAVSALSTTIQVAQNAPGILVDPGDSVSTRAMQIENLTIRHTQNNIGAAIELINSSATLQNCIFSNNENSAGGAVVIRSSNGNNTAKPLIKYNTFSHNHADSGAAIFIRETAAEILNNKFENNVAKLKGGAIAIVNGFGSQITRNFFMHDSAAFGGAISIESHTTKVNMNSTISENHFLYNGSSGEGGALAYIGKATRWSIKGNTFARNNAEEDGGAIYARDVSIFFVRDNIIVENFTENNGGGLSLVNMASGINIYSNTITGNQAKNRGGGLFLDNASGQVSVGTSLGLANNIFHNRALNQLNAITSTTPITSLNLSVNYWGKDNISSINQQVEIPSINNSLTPFKNDPVSTKIKLYGNEQEIWFADGHISFPEGSFMPTGDSTLVVRVHPDTVYTLPGRGAVLPKSYRFNWGSVVMPSVSLFPEMRFRLDNAELNALGNPPKENILVDGFNGSSWLSERLNTNSGQELVFELTALEKSQYAISLEAIDNASLFDVLPRNHAVGVNLFSPVYVTFSQGMDPTTLSTENVIVQGTQSGKKEIELSYSDNFNRLNITPLTPFLPGEQISVILNDSIKTALGSTVSNGYRWRFNMAANKGNAAFVLANVAQSRAQVSDYEWTNFNGDSLFEMVEFSGDEIAVLAKEAGSWVEKHTQSLSQTYTHFELADINLDGRNDLVCVRHNQFIAYSYSLQSGFTQIANIPLSITGKLIDVHMADHNNDGVSDVSFLLDQSEYSEVVTYFGGINTFYTLKAGTPITLVGNSKRLDDMDWNVDGQFDILASEGSASNTVGRIENKNGAFTTFYGTLTEITNQTHLLAANVWNAGQNPHQDEVIIAGEAGSKHLLKILNWDKDGNLIEVYRNELADPVLGIAIGDFNADGHNDIAIGQGNNDIRLLLSNGFGQINSSKVIIANITPMQLRAADYDGDNDIDLLLYNKSAGQSFFQIFENSTRSPRKFWVDATKTNGDGSNPNPFNAIGMAINRAIDGDTVIVAPGNYNENLRLRKMLTIKTESAGNVTLQGVLNDIAARATIDIENVKHAHLQNITVIGDPQFIQKKALRIAHVDSAHFTNLTVSDYGKSIHVLNSSAQFDTLFIRDNADYALLSDSAHIKIVQAQINGSNSDGISGTAAIMLKNKSKMDILHSVINQSTHANISASNSELYTYFSYLGDAISGESTQNGIGIVATAQSQLKVDNTAFGNNAYGGMRLTNSEAIINNSVFFANDSNAANNGVALDLAANAAAQVTNTVFTQNSRAVRVAGSAQVNINYTNFWNNKQENSGQINGNNGNLNVHPGFVYMQPSANGETQTGPDDFSDLKLAPGSKMIDAGSPEQRNGENGSRSDMGLYANIGLPNALESVPLPTIEKGLNVYTLIWQGLNTDEQEFAANTIVYRDTIPGFEPSGQNQIASISSENTTFLDSDISSAKNYFYKLAYVDNDGGTNAYSKLIYWDNFAPKTLFQAQLPDTIHQAGLTFYFTGNDSLFNNAGTPKSKLRYAYRLTEFGNESNILSDTTSQNDISFYPLNDGSFRFEIAAIDSNNNGGFGVNSRAVEFAISASELMFKSGTWHMFTIPRDMKAAERNIELPENIALKEWKDELYKDVKPDSFIAGKSYWMYSEVPAKVDLSGLPYLASDQSYLLSVKKGWNMISNPWGWTIDWRSVHVLEPTMQEIPFFEAVEKGLLDAGIYSWNGNKNIQSYELVKSDNFIPAKGYWIKAEKELLLNYNPKPFYKQPEALAKQIPFAISNKEDALLQLVVKAKNFEDRDNYYGVVKSKKSYPHFLRNAYEPPAIYDNIQLYAKADNSHFSAQLKEQRSQNQTWQWDLLIRGGEKNEKVNLSWKNLNLQTDKAYYLYHMDSGHWFPLKEGADYNFVAQGKEAQFKLFITSEAGFKPDVLPTAYRLEQNYPNPFNPSTTIRVAIPFFADGAKARLDIFDALGRKVVNLLNSKVNSGDLEVKWNGKNRLGNTVSSGVYFYRFKAAGFVATKKMVLLR